MARNIFITVIVTVAVTVFVNLFYFSYMAETFKKPLYLINTQKVLPPCISNIKNKDDLNRFYSLLRKLDRFAAEKKAIVFATQALIYCPERTCIDLTEEAISIAKEVFPEAFKNEQKSPSASQR